MGKIPISKGKNANKLLYTALHEYRPQLLRYLRSKLGNEADVEDVAQESYLRLLRVELPDLIKRPQDYLFRIASNVVHDFYLNQNRKSELIDYEKAITTGADREGTSLEDELTQRDNVRQIESLIKDLPPRQQAAFLMKKRDGLRHDEIAKKLNISIYTARTYVSQTLAHCRMKWED